MWMTLNQRFPYWGVAVRQPEKSCLCPLKRQRDVIATIMPLPGTEGGLFFCIYLRHCLPLPGREWKNWKMWKNSGKLKKKCDHNPLPVPNPDSKLKVGHGTAYCCFHVKVLNLFLRFGEPCRSVHWAPHTHSGSTGLGKCKPFCFWW